MTTGSLSQTWKQTFLETLQRSTHATTLRRAMEDNSLGAWTAGMTEVACTACDALGWDVAARGHTMETMPIQRGEYLNLDITALARNEHKWRYPTAIMELENSQNPDYIAYNLWKLLCVRADLRALYCYRQAVDDGPPLVNQLAEQVIETLAAQDYVLPAGETLVIVGNRAGNDIFPYDYFRWWALDPNTRQFRIF